MRLASWRRFSRLTVAMLAAATAGCGGMSEADVGLGGDLGDGTAAVGREASGELRLTEQGRGLTGATLRLEGHMNHAGMTPVVRLARERGGGVYDVTMRFTMTGEWNLRVSGQLPDGRYVQQDVGRILASVR